MSAPTVVPRQPYRSFPRSEEKELPGNETDDARFLTEQILTYIGNKRSLLAFIGQGVTTVAHRLGKERLTFFDAFAGTGVVSRFLKRRCERIVVADAERYAVDTTSCYLANPTGEEKGEIAHWIGVVNDRAAKELAPGFIAELYSPADDRNIRPGERAFYTRRNAMMIDTCRVLIDQIVPEELRPYALGPLLYVASVHANTSGVFKGYHKNSRTGVGQFGGDGEHALSRITKPFTLPVPLFGDPRCEVAIYWGDTNRLAPTLPTVDLAYLDPPYNQHPYGSNYFMLNLIATYRRPDAISKVSGIPVDWNRSAYNKRGEAKRALQTLVENVNARYVLLSFNAEGFITPDEMTTILGAVGETEAIETRYNTFRGSRNLRDRSLHTKEYLYLVRK